MNEWVGRFVAVTETPVYFEKSVSRIKKTVKPMNSYQKGSSGSSGQPKMVRMKGFEVNGLELLIQSLI